MLLFLNMCVCVCVICFFTDFGMNRTQPIPVVTGDVHPFMRSPSPTYHDLWPYPYSARSPTLPPPSLPPPSLSPPPAYDSVITIVDTPPPPPPPPTSPVVTSSPRAILSGAAEGLILAALDSIVTLLQGILDAMHRR